MDAPLRERPDILVLGAGGTLGEAWMRGLLSGARTAGGADASACSHFIGTSAGSIVAAVLASGRPLPAGDRLARRWAAAAGRERDANGDPAAGDADRAARAAAAARGAGEGGSAGPEALLRAARAGSLGGVLGAARGGSPGAVLRAARGAARAGAAALSPAAPLALAAAAPAGEVARAAVLLRTPRLERTLDGLRPQLETLGARFDGRLRIVAVDRETGKRVVFGAPGTPEASVPEAVLASCSVPWMFAPVPIGGREYVDGGVWSPTNLDVAPVERGTRVLCLTPLASLATAGSPFGALRAFSQAAAVAETLALRSRGARVVFVGPDRDAARAMGPQLMDAGRVERVLDAAFAQGVRLARGGAS